MMEYKLPPLPETEYLLGIPSRPYEDEMIKYAEQAIAPLVAEIERLEKQLAEERAQWVKAVQAMRDIGYD